MRGSSEGGGGGDVDGGCCGVGDTSPGTIVWVRRRNGSWWPGRILALDELPPSQIMSPRTGTPVKLLGREDASVDWYNLEKSKRVKAFRCGEFDACIEKAEATQGSLVKKREKYARREDAIIHALELERKLLASKHQIQGCRPANISACPKHHKDLGSTRYKSKKSKKRKGVSAPPDTQKEAVQYFHHDGSKRSFSESLTRGTSENLISNHLSDLSRVRHIHGGASIDSKQKNATVKKNISDGSDFDDSTEKCDRRRTVVQVLQSSANLPRQSQHNDYGAVLTLGDRDLSAVNYRAKRSRYVYLPSDSGETNSHSDLHMASTGADFETESYLRLQHPGSCSEEQTSSDLVEKHISECSERECSESGTEDDAGLLQSANMILHPQSFGHDHYFLKASNKFGHVDNYADADELTYSNYMCQLNESEEDDSSSELGVSQWHMKGKRNNRNAFKRSMDMTDGSPWLDKPNGFMEGSLHMTNDRDPRRESLYTSNQQLLGQKFYQIKEELNNDSDETDFFEDTGHSEVNWYHGNTYSSSLKATRYFSRSYSYFNDYGDPPEISPLSRDADRIFSAGRNACWDGSTFYQKYNSRLGIMGPLLLDVDLKVQASYQGEHVPLVSLMSRLNGKAIVGHPVQIEKLEDGSTDHLVSSGDISLEENAGDQPAWCTGRRTAMHRVPRFNGFNPSLYGDDKGGLAYPGLEVKPNYRNYSTSSNHQVKVDKKSSASKSQKKPSKKASLSSQKIRALSSISTGKINHQKGGQAKGHRRSGILGGLIKQGGAAPLVTCVPGKVVFSRILEAVGRPPLAVAHRVRMTCPAVRNPS